MDLSNIDLGKINDILGSLSQEEIDNLSAAAQQMFSGAAPFSQDIPQKDENVSGSPCQEGFSMPDIDPAMLMKAMTILRKLQNSAPDPRCNLIYALKPLLSPERRKKADMAAEFLRLLSLKDIFTEL